MLHIEIKGAHIPVLGLGTWRLEGTDAKDLVQDALEAGYRHVDTAQMYANENEVGHALRGSGIPRKELFVTTKVNLENLERTKFHKSVEESLRSLRLEFVDLLLIHWPHPRMRMEDYLEDLVMVKEEGLTRHIGISNFTTSQIARAVNFAPDLINNQIEYHPFIDQRKVWKACRQHGLSLTAYSPLAKGLVSKNETLSEIGRRYDKTGAQVALRWLIQQDGVIAIPKTASRQRLQENLEIFDFSLSEEEMQQVFALTAANNRLINPDHAPAWN